MSELNRKAARRRDLRWQLLSTASALALITGSCEVLGAETDDSHPIVWFELGAQLERQTGQGDLPVPPFVAAFPDSPAFNPISPGKLERVPLYSEGIEAALSFRPDQSDWVLSAGIRYGRSTHHKDVHQGHLKTEQEQFTRFPSYAYTPSGHLYYIPPPQLIITQEVYEFGGIQIAQSQHHMILDFAAGKDVGLGMLGRGGSSTLNLGVRIAQFVSNSSATMHARPDAQFKDTCHPSFAYYFGFPPSLGIDFCFVATPGFHTFAASFDVQRKFDGVGPSISWNASAPIMGEPQDGQFTFDWSVNAAILFGRQRVSGSHQTSGHDKPPKYDAKSYYLNHTPIDRSRRVTIPNAGGMVGMSLNFPNAKISVGYRGDFFFGAMDTGIDSRKTGITGFYGPFASISVGLGD